MIKKQNPAKTKQFNIYKLFTVLLLVVLLIAAAILLRNWIVRNQADRQYKDLAAQVNRLQKEMNDNAITIPSGTEDGTQIAEPEENTEEFEDSTLEQLGITVPEKVFDWKELQEINSDIYAWIYIPGTNIDYPVLQSAKDDSYYLHYNLNGTRGYPGCIYTEKKNSKDFTDFDTIMYGHNMHDDTMFATLHYLEDKAFFANCPYIYVYQDDKVFVYEIFAAYTSDNSHIWYANDFSTVGGRQIYLDKIYGNIDSSANLRSDVQATEQSHILTLSTCVKGRSQNRFLVQAVLLNEEEL